MAAVRGEVDRAAIERRAGDRGRRLARAGVGAAAARADEHGDREDGDQASDAVRGRAYEAARVPVMFGWTEHTKV